MKKILLTTLFAALVGGLMMAFASGPQLSMAEKVEYSKEKYPIKVHHEKLRMDCKDCHGNGPKSTYGELATQDCLSCHKDYKTLAERTESLGYDDNIHASPHYPKMDCNLCHSTHQKSQNYCVMCHSQDTMKKLLVP